MSIKIRRVVLANFGSFVGTHDTGLLPETGLVLIRGKNEATGGSSGAGKTTVLRAIAFALGYCPVPATKLQSWMTKDKLQVEVHLDTAAGPVVVRRGAVTSVEAGGVVTVGATAVEPVLRKVLGLPPELLEALAYRPQKTPGRFVSMTDSEKKDFLSVLLGLDKLEKLAEETQRTLAALEAEDLKYAAVENAAREQLIGYPVKEFPIEDLGEHQVKLDSAKSQHAAVAERHSAASKTLGAIEAELRALQKANAAVFDEVVLRNRAEIEQQVSELIATRPTLDYVAVEALNTQAMLLTKERREAVEAVVLEPNTRLAQLVDLRASAQKAVQEAVKKQAAEVADKRAALAATKALLDNALLAAEAVPAYTAAVDQAKQQVEMAAARKCPTCLQAWDSGTSSGYIAAEKKRLQEAEGRLAVAASAASQISEHERALEAHRAALSAAESAATVDRLRKMEVAVSEELASEKAKQEGKEETLKAKRATVSEEYNQKIYALNAKASALNLSLQEQKEKWLNEELSLGAKLREEAIAAEKQLRADQEKAVYEQQRRVVVAAGEVEAALSALNSSSLVVAGLQRALDAAVSANALAVARTEEQQRTLLRLQEGVEKAVAARASVKKKLALEKEFAHIIGREGFLGHIFEEVLAEIANETNQIVAQLPNVGDVVIGFSSETTTKTGKSNRKIAPVVHKDGVECPLDSLSGGQMTSVELAVDLAVGAVVARRTGVSPGWVVLDEAFEGHDAAVKEACLEVLERAARDRLIFVVDHATETKERFSCFVEIESDGKQSKLVTNGE